MNVFKTGLLLAALTALFLAVGYAIGGEGGMVIAFLVALAMNGFAYWNSDKMVLRMHGAYPVTRASAPELYALVETLAQRGGLPTPAVYIIESEQPNAFATGRDPEHAAVACTTGILQVLSREELAGVIAHELAHIKNRDTLIMTVAATIAGAIGMLANFAWLIPVGRTDEEGHNTNPIVALLLMILAPLAATIVQLAISRTREFGADRGGVEICGQPRWLASALQRIESYARGTYLPSAEHNPATAHLFIVNPLHGGGLAGLFRTHPSTEERIRRLLELPATGGLRSAAPGWAAGAGPTIRRGSVPTAGVSGSPWRRNPWQPWQR